MTDAGATDAARTASAFLVERAHLLLPLAAQLGHTGSEFESAIRGSSMAPAIPPATRLRVRLSGQSPTRVGDVIFYLADGGYTVHRVVFRSRRAGADYLLTEGDARFAPDPPVPPDRVLGTVVAVLVDGQWRPVDARARSSVLRRVVRALTLTAMITCLRFNAAAANRLAVALLALETRFRMSRRRFLHRRPAAPLPPVADRPRPD
jgi:hypothetical protein